MTYLAEKLFLASRNIPNSETVIFAGLQNMQEVHTNGYFEQIISGVDLSTTKGERYEDQNHMLSITLIRNNKECPKDFRECGQIKKLGDVNFSDIMEHQKNQAMLAGGIDFSEGEELLRDYLIKITYIRNLNISTNNIA